MAIQVEWQDERGETLSVYEGPSLDLRVLQFFPASSPCLSAIDPYGDAVFNQLQIPKLAAELDSILLPRGSSRVADAINSLRQFVQLRMGEIHTYLKFIGD
jgi:hypothetical protein